jgi:membrane-associated protein
MNHIGDFLNFFLHIDKNILTIVGNYGITSYLLMFIVIFCETGLVVTPFLPGDSLVFAMGAIISKTPLNLSYMFIILCIAALLGDTVNYHIGRFVGPKIFEKEKIRFLKKENLLKTQAFYEKYGGKTIIMARFIPIIRTFAPFVAGIGKMSYKRFISYNAIGGISWISLFLFVGHFFGGMTFVSKHFTVIIYIIIAVSIMPAALEFIRQRYFVKKELREELKEDEL